MVWPENRGLTFIQDWVLSIYGMYSILESCTFLYSQHPSLSSSPMGLLVLRTQESLRVRPWSTMQSWGVSTNHTVSLLLFASLGSGTSRGGLRMVRSSTGDVRVLAGDLSEALEDGVVAKESFLVGGSWKYDNLWTQSCAGLGKLMINITQNE